MVFSHHTLRTTRQPDDTDASEQPVHFGERVDRRGGTPQPPSAVETLEELYCRYPNVIAAINGHEHESYVLQHPCDGRPAGFWEVSTAAHIDWPQQSRMIELVQTNGGELAMVLTMLDHAGPPNPGDASGEQPLKLASIARELAYNDYQGSRAARGERADRNAIVLLDRPWPAASP
jgi:hypothetical protein